jgi:hypothetical protein
MDESEFLHMRHFLLHKKLHLSSVILDASLFILNGLQLRLEPAFQFFQLQGFIPEK